MNDAIQNLLTRRSIRSYKDTPVPNELLEEVIRVGLTAPSAMNKQPWHISVVRTQENIDRMADCIRDYLRANGDAERADDPSFHTFYHAPAVLYISAEDQNEKFGVSDCANLATYLCLAAHALGLGSCYIASSNMIFLSDKAEEMRAMLKIPDGFTPCFSIALGYTNGDEPEMRERRTETVSYAD